MSTTLPPPPVRGRRARPSPARPGRRSRSGAPLSCVPLSCALLVLLLSGCAARIPPSSAGGLPFAARADSLFLSPVAAGAGGNVHMARPLEKSHGRPEAYLRVWHSFLEEECRRRGLALVLPRRADSLAVADFACPLEEEEWRALYGAVPGEGSRVLVVRALRLEALRRGLGTRLLAGLNLMDDSDREYGWLDLRYEVYDVALEEGSGPRRLVSREPDTPWVSGQMDRAGRLMMKGARDLARLMDVGTP